jgi:hypothetical protein
MADLEDGITSIQEQPFARNNAYSDIVLTSLLSKNASLLASFLLILESSY